MTRFLSHSLRILSVLGILIAPTTSYAAETDVAAALDKILAGDHRAPGNTARDRYRHPKETLLFFGVKPTMTVVEIAPGGGWYTEVLAPLLNDKGRYVAGGSDKDSPSAGAQAAIREFRAKLDSRPDLYSKAVVSEFGPQKLVTVPPGTADMVLTFRNVHNWMGREWADTAFKAMFDMLKPGGVLGVVEHRGRTDQPQDPKASSGYVRQDYVIALAEKAGFKLAATSEINANPKDTKDYKDGVWTLPPRLFLENTDREKYLAIGESDRMTLKFVKP